MRSQLRDPAISALIDFSQDHQVVVEWGDGGEALVLFDVFFPSDETYDESEEAIVKVVRIYRSAPSVEIQSEQGDIVISSNNPPIKVTSPDRSRSWTATHTEA